MRQEGLKGILTGKPGFEHVCLDCKNAFGSRFPQGTTPGLQAHRQRMAPNTEENMSTEKPDVRLMSPKAGNGQGSVK